MSAPDTLDSLTCELAAMHPGARRAILRRLSPADRDRLEGAMAAADIVPVRPDMTPWLAARIAGARDDREMPLSSATRQALLRSAAPGMPPPAMPADRSLLGVIGGLFSASRRRA